MVISELDDQHIMDIYEQLVHRKKYVEICRVNNVEKLIKCLEIKEIKTVDNYVDIVDEFKQYAHNYY